MAGNSLAIAAILQSALRDYVDKAADEVKQIIQEFIQRYYAEYDPVLYERTYQFLNSVVRTEVAAEAGGASCTIYINTDAMGYTGTGGAPVPTGKQVVDWAAHGIHGGVVMGGSPFWSDAMQKISDEGIMTIKLVQYLMSKGFQVRG